MVKQKITTTKTTVEAHTWSCPKCDKIIVGSTSGQVKYNADLHLDTHKGENK